MQRFWGLCIGASLAAWPAMAQDGRVGAGREVAARWCVNCHVVDPAQASGNDVTPSFRSVANRPGTTAESLHVFLAVPHGKMPFQALSNPYLDSVSAYILSLKR